MEKPPSLWILTGTEPVWFQLPYYGYGKDDVTLVPAVTFLVMQELAADKILKAFAKKTDEGHWKLPYADLKTIAFKGNVEDNPETVVVWERPRTKPSHLFREGLKDRDEFCEYAHKMGFGESPEIIKFIWTQFQKVMADWIIEKHRPIDLGFAVIRSVPLRDDWKHVHLERINLTLESHLIEVTPTMEELCTPEMLAVDKHGQICYLHLEIEERHQWRMLTTKHERRLREQLGPEAYAKQHFQKIRRAYPKLRRLFSIWFKAKRHPFARCEPGDIPGDFRFFRSNGDDPWDRELRFWRRIFAVVQHKLEKAAGHKKKISRPDGALPAMRNVQPETKDVRDGGGNIQSAAGTG